MNSRQHPAAAGRQGGKQNPGEDDHLHRTKLGCQRAACRAICHLKTGGGSVQSAVMFAFGLGF